MSDRSPHSKTTPEKTAHKANPDVAEKQKAQAADQAKDARQKLSAESRIGQKESKDNHKKPVSESSTARLTHAAEELHQALHQRAWGGLGGPEPNVDKTLNILETLSPADRKQLEKLYDQQYNKMGDNLRKDIESAFPNKNSADLSHIKRVLDRPAGAADVAGQIEWAAKCIKEGKNNKRAMEKVIIDAVSMCDSKDIKQLGLDAKLGDIPNLSQETEHALHLLSLGKDRLYDKGHMKDNIVHTLSNLALDSHPPRLDLYKLALQSASPDYRNTLKRQGAERAIDKAFSGDDAKIAKDYLNKGLESTVTKVAGDHKEILGLQWWNNKDNITRSMESASTEEKGLYKQGEQLANKYRLGEWLSQHGGQARSKGEQEALKTFQSLQKDGKAPANDREAFKFYNDLKGELDKAGNPREVKLWEAKLLGAEDLVSNLAKCHTDNIVPGLPGSHKAEDLYKTVENLSEKDWKQFRQHPEDLAHVAKTLGTFASQEELNKVMSMLRQKINVKDKDWTYSESKQVGHRKVTEVFEQNKANPFEEFWQHNTDKPADKIEGLMNMTAAERRAYRDPDSKFHQHVDELIKKDLNSGTEQDLAKRILDKVKHNKPYDALDRLMLDDIKGKQTDVRKTVQDMEAVYKENPALLKDQKIKAYFEKVLENAVNKSGLGTIMSQGYVRPSRYHEFADGLFKDGHVPLGLKMEITPNKEQRLELIKNATPEECKKLVADKPDEATKAYQDKVLGTDAERSFLQHVLQTRADDKPIDLADQCRAFAIGYGGDDPTQLAATVKNLPDQQKQSLANEYFARYGKQLADDFIQKTPEAEKRTIREAFAEFPISSKQALLNADANRAERREDRWDATKQAADESVEKLLKFVREHKQDIDKMPDKEKKEFLKAVEDYQKAEKAYVESGGQQAEALVNATITALSLGALLIPGGQAITAARLTAFAAGGGAFRVAAMKCIQGKDFNGSAENILEQVFHGSTDAVLCFAGPEMLGMKVGGNAVKVALKTGLEEAGVAGAKFTSGLESALTRQLDNATCNDALRGSKTLRDKVEQAFRDNAITGTTEKEIQDATNAYMKQLQKETAVKVLAKEATDAGVNVGTGYVSSAGAQLATDIAFPPKEGLTPEQVFNRCAESGTQGAAGGAIFHFGFKGLGAAYHGSKGTIGKVVDAAGKDRYFAKDGTVIQHADGTKTITGKDREFLKEGDRIVPPVKAAEAQKPDTIAQAKSTYMADTGELRGTIPNGYTDLGPGQKISSDGRISSGRGAPSYDAIHDQVLQQFKADAKAHMDRFKKEHPNTKKQDLMEEAIRWEKQRFGPQTTADEKAYTKYLNENGGRRIPVGELIDRGQLGCSERAHLLKIIADENIGEGYARLIRGDGSGDGTSNHVWIATGEGKATTIWDASRERHKVHQSETGHKYTPESHLVGYGHGVRPEDIRPGAPVPGSPGWRFAEVQPKNTKYVGVVHEGIHLNIPKEQLHRHLPPLHGNAMTADEAAQFADMLLRGTDLATLTQNAQELLALNPDVDAKNLLQHCILHEMPKTVEQLRYLDDTLAGQTIDTTMKELVATAGQYGITPVEIQQSIKTGFHRAITNVHPSQIAGAKKDLDRLKTQLREREIIPEETVQHIDSEFKALELQRKLTPKQQEELSQINAELNFLHEWADQLPSTWLTKHDYNEKLDALGLVLDKSGDEWDVLDKVTKERLCGNGMTGGHKYFLPYNWNGKAGVVRARELRLVDRLKKLEQSMTQSGNSLSTQEQKQIFDQAYQELEAAKVQYEDKGRL